MSDETGVDATEARISSATDLKISSVYTNSAA